MKLNRNLLHEKKGFTFIEVLIVLFIFSLIVTTFYSVFAVGMKNIIESKNKLAATALGNEKMEIVRNLDYNSIGTQHGIPQGSLMEKETINVNTRTFYIFSFVEYIDDSFDGMQGKSPNDLVPTDYKKVRIKVTWEDDISTNKAVSIISNFIPKGVETNVGGGTLSINVLSSTEGKGIPQAEVRIVNSETSTDITTLTDDSGNIYLPGAKQSIQKYAISVSKDGYFPVHTYSPYLATASFRPTNVDATVTTGQLNSFSILTDKVSKIILTTKDALGNSLPNAIFDLRGGMKKGETVTIPVEALYEYEQTGLSSVAEGKLELSNMSCGTYFLKNIGTISGYTFLGTYANGITENSEGYSFNVISNETTEVNLVWAKQDVNSILVTVLNNSNSSPIAGATVELKSVPNNYDVILTTNSYGQVFFPTEAETLVAGQYELIVNASGFQVLDTTDLNISGFSKKEIKLTYN